MEQVKVNVNKYRPRLQSYSQQKKIKKNSFFIGHHEDSVIMKHEEIDVHKSYIFTQNNKKEINIQNNNNDNDNIQNQQQSQDNQENEVNHKNQKDKMLRERVEDRKSSNLQVIMAITNTLIGSVVLCLPYNWLHGGFLSSLIIMVIMGAISFYTVKIYVQNQMPGDTDASQVVERILGKTYGKIFEIMSSILLFVVGIVYFMLQNQVLYAFINFIYYYIDQDLNLPAIDSIDFSTFSVQYQCMILAIPVFFVISMKELSLIIKLGQYGVLAIIVYGGYMAYLSIYNISLSNFSANWDKVHLFPNDFSQVILVMGNFSLAFLSHNAITTMLANAKDQSKNTRNVSLGYLNVLSIYGLIGIFGAVGILNLDWEQDGIQTVSQLFDRQDVMPAIINVLFLFQLSTSLPIICFISRSQMMRIIFKGNMNYSHKYNILFNIGFIFFAVLIQVLAIDPNLVIGLDGAICGFYMLYFISFYMRLKTFGKKPPVKRATEKYSIKLKELALIIKESQEDKKSDTKSDFKQNNAVEQNQQQDTQQEDQNNHKNKQDSGETAAAPLENHVYDTQTSLTQEKQQKIKQDLYQFYQEYYKGIQKLPVLEYIMWFAMISIGVAGAFLQIYGIFI